ncbi:unnamed protein product (macronuclear) [Paramecium tetraurelia]|uniref:Uncharacterized protein n=1 Tax=Paramecium tetraurelia TaxID=5888 RepID=A0DC29_PARTE|nr:uncharacterized protein GSPATT00015473001 [Paramecium tetraurelia]CAK80596.1 unnamed protein product [Paramecium tetraurelia]|eukprot:XP_001447993.1 hypothetical protein (macronuclear) [Paramecium tetraurelia strain d4-2]
MLQFNQNQLIGPKPIFMQPLESYRNLDVDDTQCTDDFSNKILSQTNNSLIETAQIKSEGIRKKKNSNKNVKFNLNIVRCQFNQKEPAMAIGKLVQKLINQKPHLYWVNPQILKNQ